MLLLIAACGSPSESEELGTPNDGSVSDGSDDVQDSDVQAVGNDKTDFVPLRVARFRDGPQDALCGSSMDSYNWTPAGSVERCVYDAFSPTPATNNSFVGRTNLLKGATGWGGGWNVDDNNGPIQIGEGGEFWVRLFVWMPSDFIVNTPNDGMKLMRIGESNSPGKLDVKLLNGGLGLKLEWDEVRTRADDTPSSGSYSVASGNTPFPRDQWVNVEWYVKVSRNKDLGAMRLYLNGKLEAEIDENIVTISSADSQILGSRFGDYYNGGAPENQNFWVRDYVSATHLSPPTNQGSDGSPIIGNAIF